MQQLVKDDPQGPYIYCVCIRVELGLLRGYILLRSRDSLHYYVLGAQSEVSNLQVWKLFAFHILARQKNILRFQISMGYSLIVELLHSSGNMKYALEGLFFRKLMVFETVEGMPSLKE